MFKLKRLKIMHTEALGDCDTYRK